VAEAGTPEGPVEVVEETIVDVVPEAASEPASGEES
jgi:hypothetical protein